jgi:hypothetical protein
MDRELMDTEKLIEETFTAHEHVVPDGDTVLAAARQRIDRRRVMLSRPLVVAAGVIALTLAVVTAVALNRPNPTPADNAQVAGPVGKSSTEPAIAGLRMPYSLGWLPPGKVEYLVHRINTGATAENPEVPLYGGEYMFTVAVGGQVLYVDVQEFKMSPVEDDMRFKSGPGNPVTINGQHGVESANSDGPGGYELYLTHPENGSMYVNVSAQNGGTAPAQQLIDTGRQIAEHIQFPGTTTVTPAFGLRDLPAGVKMCTFDVETGLGLGRGRADPSTSYSLGTCATMPPIHVDTTGTDTSSGTPGQPVQGHATRYLDDGGYRTLSVLDAVDGAPVAIAGSVPLTDLYDIANRLLLPR